MMNATGLELETFIVTNEVDEPTAHWLQVQSEDVVSHLLIDPPDPGAGFLKALVSRVQKIAVEVDDAAADVARFIESSGIDDWARQNVVMQTEDIQQAVVRLGPLTGIRNPSAEIMARIGKAKHLAETGEPMATIEYKERGKRGIHKRGGVKNREKKEAWALANQAAANLGGPAVDFGSETFVPPPPPMTPPPRGTIALRPAVTKVMGGWAGDSAGWAGDGNDFPYMLNSALQDFQAYAMQVDQSEDGLRAIFERVLTVRRAGGAIPSGAKRARGPTSERLPRPKVPRVEDGSPEAEARAQQLVDAIVKVVAQAGGRLNIERVGGTPAVKNLRRGLSEADSLATFIRAHPAELSVEEGDPRADGNKILHILAGPSPSWS